MTLGEKIRKYRTLKGMTQKELGIAVGFSAATADSRIRKYESDIMAPKNDMRQKLADALDVDISALSDVELQSNEDIIQILFELEDLLGLDINHNVDFTTLTIPHDSDRQLDSYFYAWYTQKKRSARDESSDDYEKWKARFPKDITTYLIEQSKYLDDFYSSHISKITVDCSPIQKLSEFLLLIRRQFQAGIDIEFGLKSFGVGDGALIMTYNIFQLCNTSNRAIQDSFAEYLYTLEILKTYGMPISRELSISELGTKVSYVLRWSVLTAFRSTLSELMEFEKSIATLSDFEKDQFERRFTSDLQKYDIDLKNELSNLKNSLE